jgi:hypothetical protein
LPEVEWKVGWFDPALTRTAVRALAEHLRSRPEALPDSRDVLADLVEFEQELSDAATAGVPIRLAVVP